MAQNPKDRITTLIISLKIMNNLQECGHGRKSLCVRRSVRYHVLLTIYID